MKILLVEDEVQLSQSMSDYLSASGYLCESAFTYDSALEKTETNDYDCIVLDLMLPGGSGLDLLRNLKLNRKKEGVIIISAKDALDDKLLGLKIGADDYLTKPFHLSELSVRISAIMRRRHQDGLPVIQAGDILVNTEAREVCVGETVLDLTFKEYELLVFMLINKNRVLSKNAIARHLWGDEMDMAANYDFLYTHIKNLRKKITLAGGSDCIRSVYGAGYKLNLP